MNSFLFFQDFLGFSILYQAEEEKRKRRTIIPSTKNMRKKPQKNSEPKQWGKLYQKNKATKRLFGKYPQKGHLLSAKKRADEGGKRNQNEKRKRKPIQLQKTNSRENKKEEIKNTKTIRESIEGDRNTGHKKP